MDPVTDPVAAPPADLPLELRGDLRQLALGRVLGIEVALTPVELHPHRLAPVPNPESGPVSLVEVGERKEQRSHELARWLALVPCVIA